MVAGAKAIAVADEKRLAAQQIGLRQAMHGNAQFVGEVVAHPHIVVAGEEGDGQARIGEFGELSLKPDEPLRNGVPVFKPEIEHVAHQKQRGGIGLNLIEPAHHGLFAFTAEGGRRGAKVKIGGKIDTLTGRQRNRRGFDHAGQRYVRDHPTTTRLTTFSAPSPAVC